MYKLILFDFDGTVADNSRGIFNCINYALDKMGEKHLPPDILRRFVGPSLFDSYYKYCAEDETRAQRFVDLYRERYAPVGTTEVQLYDGITDVLNRAKTNGAKIAVCSGKPYEFIVKIARLTGIFDIFDGYFCPGFATHSSTKTELISEAAQYFSAENKDVLMVGDTKFDIISAKEAGVDSLGVLYGFSEPGELKSEGAEYIASTVCELEDLIGRLTADKKELKR